MVDYTAKGEEKKKRGGCLPAFLIILLVLGLGALGMYFYLPSLISGTLSGKGLAKILPESFRAETEQLNREVGQQIEMLRQAGFPPQQLESILRDLDLPKIEDILDEAETSGITDTDQLIDIVSRHVDLSSLDLEKLKRKYYSQISPDELKDGIERFRESPLFSKSGFSIMKGTILKVLEDQSGETE